MKVWGPVVLRGGGLIGRVRERLNVQCRELSPENRDSVARRFELECRACLEV